MTESNHAQRGSTTRLTLASATLLIFGAFSTLVVVEHGYLGFVDQVALASDWGLQVFLDLGIALFLFTGWMFRDARERALPAWPHLLGILTLGSIGALTYLVHREVAALRRGAPVPA